MFKDEERGVQKEEENSIKTRLGKQKAREIS